MQPSQPGPLPDDPRGPIRPWSSLFYRDFAMLWTGGFFSASATQMRYMASFFQVYEISGSALQLGITGVFQAVPFVLFGLFGGVAADAFDRKKMLIITQILNIFPSLAIGLLTLTGGIQVWHIYALITVSSFVGIFGRPARTAYIPRLVPRSRLMNAVTLNTVTDQSTFLIGPVMAGVLIEVLGMGNAYLFNAALFVPAVVTAVAIRTSGRIEGGGRKVSLKSMFEALEFVWVQRIVLSLLLLDLGATVVGFYRPLLPVFAKDVFRVSASGFGILAGAPAIGSVLGSATLLLVGDVRRKGVSGRCGGLPLWRQPVPAGRLAMVLDGPLRRGHPRLHRRHQRHRPPHDHPAPGARQHPRPSSQHDDRLRPGRQLLGGIRGRGRRDLGRRTQRTTGG